jgi:hypothetical protein
MIIAQEEIAKCKIYHVNPIFLQNIEKFIKTKVADDLAEKRLSLGLPDGWVKISLTKKKGKNNKDETMEQIILNFDIGINEVLLKTFVQ